MTNEVLSKSAITANTIRPLQEGGFILSGPVVTVNLPAVPGRYLTHGWQSWSLTAWTGTSRRVPVMRPSSMHPMQTDPVYVRDRRPNGSWYGAVEVDDGQILFIGALGLEAHVALEGTSLKGWYENDRDSTAAFEWFVATGDESQVLARYAEMLGERFGKGRLQTPPRVWCSWYSLYTEIEEGKLLKILKDLGDLPFEVFQIDDGWQKCVGDWEPNAKFPSGMDGIAAQIRATGRTPGLWLAPLLVVPSSSLFRERKEWLLRDDAGKLVPAGLNWGEKLYALDTTHPEVVIWLLRLMGEVREWGYGYAKLDFLYAGALPGKRFNGMSRENAYRYGLKVIRKALGDTYFLTCGAPILPSLGLCDGLRVGPDVSGLWENPRDRDLLVNFTAPGTRNAIRTSLNRLWLQPLLHTDPDVVYFGSRENALAPAQRLLLQDLARVAGFKATSEVPAWLTDAERGALHEYLVSNPPAKKVGKYKYQIDRREVDFSSAVELPSLPSLPQNILGWMVGELASSPLLMKIYEIVHQRFFKKALKKSPV